MRSWALLAAFATTVAPLGMAQEVTVQQLQQFLARESTARETDQNISRRLASVELNERLSASRLAHIEAKISPGPKTREALNLLADQSAFLEPPSGELPRINPPARAKQKSMIDAAKRFVFVTMKQMPNFMANRDTTSFKDVPVSTRHGTFQSGLNFTGSSSTSVTYRDGHEVPDSSFLAAHMAGTTPLAELTSIGEFGPLLAAIMADSANGSVIWSHWERISSGLTAVFQYKVPLEASHYAFDFCCVWDPGTKRLLSYHGTRAYHGQLWIDPATGAVMRVTVESKPATSGGFLHFALMVDYGKVNIGGKLSICPLHSVYISTVRTSADGKYWEYRFLNEVRFTRYRRFGSTVRILSAMPPK